MQTKFSLEYKCRLKAFHRLWLSQWGVIMLTLRSQNDVDLTFYGNSLSGWLLWKHWLAVSCITHIDL